MQDFREVGDASQQLGPLGRRRRARHRQPDHAGARSSAASQLVKRGAIFDLGIPFDGNGPQPGGGRINPVRLMSETGAAPGVPRRLPLRRRLRVHAAAVGVAVGRPGPRLLRRPAVQRVPVERRRPARRQALLDRQDGQGHRRARRAARHRPPQGRRLAAGRRGHHAGGPRRRGRAPGRRGRQSATSCSSAPAGARSSSRSRTRPSSWPASPASASPAPSGCTTTRSP